MPAADRAGRPTFIDSDRALARFVARPLQRFLAVEAAGGILLLVATVVALVWANSPWKAAYGSLLHADLGLELGSVSLREDLLHWVNDGLMALFFLVVGLEIKREWVVGELRDRRAAVLPIVAAVGGMAVPALVFLAVIGAGDGARGWGIPMATDIAFALGILVALGSRVPPSLRTFLLTLAIVDDIGAILVIAVVYSDSLAPGWLAGAGLVVAAVVALRWARVQHQAVYVVAGLALWLCVFESGVHATIAGVAMGLLAPARPFQPEVESEAVIDTLEGREDLRVEDVRRVSFLVRSSVPVADRLIGLLHPWTSYLIVPIFALANAGIVLGSGSFTAGRAVFGAVLLGLVLGKPIGIVASSWLAVRLGVARRPDGVGWLHLTGAGVLGGIGFTVSLFVTGLAFADAGHQGQAKVGILLASAIAALAGAGLLVVAGRTAARQGDDPAGERGGAQPPSRAADGKSG